MDTMKSWIEVGVNPSTDLQRQIDAIGQTIKNAFGELFGVALPALSIAGFAKITDNMANRIEKLSNAGKSLNMGIGEIDKWTGAMELAGVGADQFIGSLQNINNQIREISRGQRPAMWIESIRGWLPSGDGYRGKNGSVRWLRDVADMAKRNDVKNNATLYAEMSQALTKMGVDGKTAYALLNGELDKYLERSEKLGILTEEDEKKARSYQFAIRSVQRAWTVMQEKIFATLAPAMEFLADCVLKVVDAFDYLLPILMGLASGTAFIAISKFIKMIAGSHILAAVGYWTALTLAFRGLATIFESAGMKQFAEMLRDPKSIVVAGLAIKGVATALSWLRGGFRTRRKGGGGVLGGVVDTFAGKSSLTASVVNVHGGIVNVYGGGGGGIPGVDLPSGTPRTSSRYGTKYGTGRSRRILATQRLSRMRGGSVLSRIGRTIAETLGLNAVANIATSGINKAPIQYGTGTARSLKLDGIGTVSTAIGNSGRTLGRMINHGLQSASMGMSKLALKGSLIYGAVAKRGGQVISSLAHTGGNVARAVVNVANKGAQAIGFGLSKLALKGSLVFGALVKRGSQIINGAVTAGSNAIKVASSGASRLFATLATTGKHAFESIVASGTKLFNSLVAGGGKLVSTLKNGGSKVLSMGGRMIGKVGGLAGATSMLFGGMDLFSQGKDLMKNGKGDWLSMLLSLIQVIAPLFGPIGLLASMAAGSGGALYDLYKDQNNGKGFEFAQVDLNRGNTQNTTNNTVIYNVSGNLDSGILANGMPAQKSYVGGT